MKKSLLLLIFIILGLCVYGQGQIRRTEPMKGEINKSWKEFNHSFFENPLNKDTVHSIPLNNKYIETKSGLKYVILGKGIKNYIAKSPWSNELVTLDYIGVLPNGEVFDNSIERGQPISLKLENSILGWKEGLQLMEEGQSAVFYLPPTLAYGEKGIINNSTSDYLIPPSTPLVFWIHLIQIN